MPFASQLVPVLTGQSMPSRPRVAAAARSQSLGQNLALTSCYGFGTLLFVSFVALTARC